MPFFMLISVLFLAGGATAATRASVEATVIATAEPVQLDGRLTDPVWRRAPVIRGFVQREPNDGARASFDTEVRLAFDSAALYVGARAFDPEPAKIVGLLTRRDSHSPSDWIRVVVDSYHDRRTAFEFAINPAGVKQDKYWFNDGAGNDPGWDAVWDVAAARDGDGWSAEFRIPFSQLRMPTGTAPTFGIAVVREIARLNEISSWPHLPKGASGYVSSFAELSGLELEEAGKRIEVVPYVVGQIDTRPVQPGNPLVRGADPQAAAGLDIKYSLTPGLTLTGTINPDFGQVEADPAVLNLSAFEVFFQERRPFFVEGSEIFRFNVDCSDGECTGLFYSRRIGRSPQLSVEVPEGAHALAPLQTTILGAAKLSGRIGGFSLGALNALTASEHATIADGPSRYSQPVEPASSYSVVRGRKDFADQSSLGFMFTATNRRLPESAVALPDQAYTGGVDWDWRLGERYSFSGYWAGSTVHGDPEAISGLQQSNTHLYHRPDASHVEFDPTRSRLSGHSLMLSIGKIGGDRVRFNSNVSFKSPGFDINDLGFFRRADERTVSNWLQLRHDKPSRYLRSFRINFNQWASWNFDGDRLFSGGNVNAHAVFTNNWRTGAGINIHGSSFDDRLTRGGPGGLENGALSLWHYISTDNRRLVHGG
ncbi:MAG: DUF5916 domain-containing protein, partial [Acidobacteriota bacterium]